MIVTALRLGSLKIAELFKCTQILVRVCVCVCLQPDLRDPPSAHPAVAAEPLHRRGTGQEAAGAHPPGPAERQATSHGDGAALPRAGGHHSQGQAADGAAGRGGVASLPPLSLLLQKNWLLQYPVH